MSQPRQIIPGRTYLVTRRCSEQRFFLRPSSKTNEVFSYCLAHAAEVYNVELHAVCVMSNHWHVVLTDTDGRLPEFMAWVHKYVAKCLNQYLGRNENLWSTEKYSAQWLPTEAEVIDKIRYVLLNPVKSNLVKQAAHWPGLTSARVVFGSKTVCFRPNGYFRKNGQMPDKHILRFSRPPCLRTLSNDDLSALVNDGVTAGEAAYGRDRTYPVLGVHAIAGTSPTDQPHVRKRVQGRNLSFTGKSAAVFAYAMAEVKAFRQAYRAAFTEFSQGVHETIFPPGTYKLRLLAGVRCASV